MNYRKRRTLAELHKREMQRLEARFIRRMEKILRAQVAVFTSIIKNSESPRNDIDRILTIEGLAEEIKRIWRFFGLYQYRKTAKQIRTSVKEQKAGFGINEELLRAIINFLNERILIKAILPITKSLKALILARLIEGQQNGWGVDRIAREIEQNDYPRWMARRVVRTESVMAMNFGDKRAISDSKYETESEWIAANDHRTRHSHRDVDGNKVDEGERFRVPIYKGKAIVGYDFMTGPGDPTAHASNLINCRCSKATVAKRDRNGRLILKKVGNSRISVILPQERFVPHSIITI